MRRGANRAAIKSSQVGRAIYRLFVSALATLRKSRAIIRVARESVKLNGIRVLLSRRRESGGPMLDNLHDFLFHCLLPRRRFFVLVIVRVIRLRQLYWRPGERFAVDNRNRLQTLRAFPAAISTFLLLHRYILFPWRAFPPTATNNTSARRRPRRDDNKVVGEAIVRPVIRPTRLPRV